MAKQGQSQEALGKEHQVQGVNGTVIVTSELAGEALKQKVGGR